MRLEFNPRALCYNLYCDTNEEHKKMKQMLEKPFTALDLKSIDNMIYADTDSVYTMKTKLNSVYGRMVTDLAKDYIVIHNDNKPAIIFKKFIVGVQKCDDDTAYIQTVSSSYYADDKYADVIKMLI